MDPDAARGLRVISDEAYGSILDEGIRLWNRHRFFECHDKLEEAWRAVKQEKKREPARDPRRDFLHGLILLSVAYLHWRNRNRIGALRKYQEARVLLAPYPPHFSGVGLAQLLDRVAADFGRCEASEAERFLPGRVPRIPTLAKGAKGV